MKPTFVVVILLLLATTIVRAQNEKPVSNLALSRIMRIVLRDEFKPAKEPKKIYLSERFLSPTWLPKIRNIEFVLITDTEFKERGKAYYLAKAPYWEEGAVRVDFGFGDRDCDASGSSYFFRVTGNRVRWAKNKNGAWGRACAHGSG